jgi:hypothetical protein
LGFCIGGIHNPSPKTDNILSRSDILIALYVYMAKLNIIVHKEQCIDPGFKLQKRHTTLEQNLASFHFILNCSISLGSVDQYDLIIKFINSNTNEWYRYLQPSTEYICYYTIFGDCNFMALQLDVGGLID